MDSTDSNADDSGPGPRRDRPRSDRNGPSLDATFENLAHRRRRAVLIHLLETEEGTTSVDDLGATVVDQEPHSPPPSRERVNTTLHHNHLPRLADAGFIDYDHESGRVVARDCIERCGPFIATVWSEFGSDDTTERP